MDFSAKPINSTKRAKAYFQAMGCSSFHMSRGYPERYDEYCRLGITTETENEWTRESVEDAFGSLCKTSTKKADLWHIHSRMEDLVQQLKTEDALVRIFVATETIVDRLSNRSKLLVAETIDGRGLPKHRQGLVFLAHDLNHTDIAKRFSEVALSLISSAINAGIEPERSGRALETCKEIRQILGFT